MLSLDDILGPVSPLEHFTNRKEQLELIRARLRAPAGAHLPMIMFFGVGGTGKSHLFARIHHLIGEEIRLPVAKINFDRSSGANNLADSVPATLFTIAQQLDVDCPRFDLAYLQLLQLQNLAAHGGGEPSPGTRVMDIAESGLVDLVGALLPGGNALIKAARVSIDYFTAPRRTHVYQHFIKSDDGTKLKNWLANVDPATVAARLGDLLARDLVEALPARPGHACRAVLMLDTMEHLRRSGSQGLQQFTDKEAWIFGLWNALHQNSDTGGDPVQFLLFGRDKLDEWVEYSSQMQKLAALEHCAVDGFSTEDALEYLERRGIQEVPLQQAILASALDVSVTGAERAYHPLSLGLLADTVTEDRRQGKPTDPATLRFSPGQLDQLAMRFLQSLAEPAAEYRVIRLARTPQFDEAAIRALSGLGTIDAEAVARRILRYSFVRGAATQGWWTIHPRMRETILKLPRFGDPDSVRTDHDEWSAYWATRSTTPTDTHAGLRWFHNYQLDPEGAIREWSTLEKSLRLQLRMREQEQILAWWGPLGLETMACVENTSARACATLASALTSASHGSLRENARRAASLYRAILGLHTRENFADSWALAKNELGNTLRIQAMYERRAAATKLLAEAVTAYRAALEVRTREVFPKDWAMTSHNLGIALRQQATHVEETSTALLVEAVSVLRAALEIHTRESFPQEWAGTQQELGTALRDWAKREDGGTASTLLAEAVVAYEAALEVYTSDASPQNWAATRSNLRSTLFDQAASAEGVEATELIAKAVATHHRAAMEIYTREKFPEAWARDKCTLGRALRERANRVESGGNSGKLLAKAVAMYRLALEVYTRDDFPLDWAKTQNNLGVALEDQASRAMALADDEDVLELLKQAGTAFRAAMEIYTLDEYPVEWARTQEDIGRTWLTHADWLTVHDRESALLPEAVTAYRAALEVYSRDRFPEDWARIQDHSGVALHRQALDAEGAAAVSLFAEAATAYRAALEVYSRDELPMEWARTLGNLGRALCNLALDADGAAAISLFAEAATAYRSTLEVHTREDFPQDWAETQIELGRVLRLRASLSEGEIAAALLAEAATAYYAALEVFYREIFPEDWATAQHELGTTLREQAAHKTGLTATLLLERAAEAFREAKDGLDVPQEWAKNQYDLGNVLSELAERRVSAATALRTEALAAYREALAVYTKEDYPTEWAATIEKLSTLDPQATLLGDSVTATQSLPGKLAGDNV